MFKKRTRPNARRRDTEEDLPSTLEEDSDEEGNVKLSPEELLALRKLKRGRQGIDVSKLNKGEGRKQKRVKPEEVLEGDLSSKDSDEEARARRVVRANNFTQQTNALDVDKHMMAYIEENIKKRQGDNATKPKQDEGPRDPYEELYRITDRYSTQKKVDEEGNVTNSLAMLTAIPEVDLGMDTRLKNIEETEKAKRQVAEDRRIGRSKEENAIRKDEEHLAASRFYRPHSTQQTDAEALRRAKLEAMGLSPEPDPRRPYNEGRNQMATDDMVMERFKKRMRK
ncbi:hypothetical protein K439DRAFT_1650317 [Ramaria rubella]|nr:hypothetical protein K439DRAFT_1650317 [Ramaria rubella]